jgi:hypothetical protein
VCSSDNVCTACPNLSFRTVVNGSCVCSGYTVDIGMPACSSCYPTCYSCSLGFSAAGCLSCNLSRDHRSFLASNSSCNCVDGYYEIPGLSTNYNPYINNGAPCLACQYSCATCTNISACASCSGANNRTLNASSGFCSCGIGHYDDGLSQACASCLYSCLTCQASPANCSSCPSTRTLTNSSCPCAAGKFDAGVSACQPCDYSCWSCSNSSSCLTCSSVYFRTMASSGLCVCTTGYYDTYGVASCGSCDPTC